MPLLCALDALFDQWQTYIHESEANAQNLIRIHGSLDHSGHFEFNSNPHEHLSAHATLEQAFRIKALQERVEIAAAEFHAHPVAQALYLTLSLSASFSPAHARQGSARISRVLLNAEHARIFSFGPQKHANKPTDTLPQSLAKARAFLEKILALPIRPTDPAWVYSCATGEQSTHVTFPFHAPDLDTARAIAETYMPSNKAKKTVFSLPRDEIPTFLSYYHLRPF